MAKIDSLSANSQDGGRQYAVVETEEQKKSKISGFLQEPAIRFQALLCFSYKGLRSEQNFSN